MANFNLTENQKIQALNCAMNRRLKVGIIEPLPTDVDANKGAFAYLVDGDGDSLKCPYTTGDGRRCGTHCPQFFVSGNNDIAGRHSITLLCCGTSFKAWLA